MSETVRSPSAAAALADRPRPSALRLCASLAPTVLAFAVSVGISGDALLRQGIGGAGLAAWVAITAVATVALVWRAGAPPSAQAWAWLAAAVTAASAVAWRNAELLQALDLLAAIGAMIMAAVAINGRGWWIAAPYTALLAAFRVVRGAAFGFVPLARETALTRGASRWGARATLIARIVAVAAPVALIFGALLREADPIFASYLTVPGIDFEALLSHALVIAVLAWLSGGWARAALVPSAEQTPVAIGTIRLGTLEVTTVLLTLDLLFAAFVAAQASWFFSGETYLRARTGLTVADYARRGFFQMVWVAALVVPVIIGTRIMSPPTRAARRRHTVLALPLVALTGAIIASAAFRLRMYVGYYGLSVERLYPLAFVIWLAFVLCWLTATVLRDKARLFASGAFLSAAMTLAALNVADPDVVAARFNVARARTPSTATRPLDVRYLSTLGGEAVPIVTGAILDDARAARGRADGAADRCAALGNLLTRWGPESPAAARMLRGGWRAWNAGAIKAVRVVREHAPDIEASRQATCAVVPADRR